MIPLSIFQQMLKAFAKKYTGIEWYWQDEPQSSYAPYPMGFLNGPFDMRSPGTDAVVWIKETDGAMTPTVQGDTIGSFKFQVVSNNQSPNSKAHTAITKLRLGFSLPNCVAGFNLVGFSCLNPDTAQVINMPAPFSMGDRVDSIVSVSMDFYMSLETFSDEIGAGGKLEKIEIASQMLGIDPLVIDSTVPLSIE